MSAIALPYEGGALLQEWADEHEPDDKMSWKGNFWAQVMFVRDQLNPLFCLDFPVRVVGSHLSKSIQLPVYSISVPGRVTIVLRNNFHNWIVSVDSLTPVPDVFFGLLYRMEQQMPLYCHGFREAWVFPSYAESSKRFTLAFGSEYSLYTFCFLLVHGLGLRGSDHG